MITAFGKFIRELRYQHSELLKDMANTLAVSAAFLSAVETGKKSIPPHWKLTLVEKYKLVESNAQLLSDAIDQSQKSATIDLTSVNSEHRGVAVALARQFNNLSSADFEIIKNTMVSARNRLKDQ